jgi:NADH-quinone oxidoreductase subunit L
MFWLALITAYVTPFYMMRAWWMTFMGKPRDEHVHSHAHETRLMYVPLVVLAVGTFVASYFLFRPMISDAAPAATAAAAVLATDGGKHTEAMNAAHHFLVFGVGGAFLVGFALAFAIYRNGLATADKIRRVLSPLHTLLVHKYFFDEVYDFVWVKGCILVARICRLIDTYVVDMIFNLSAAITERFAAFAGLIIDNHGVDGMVNGIAKSSMDFAGVVRGPQTGRIRNYVLFAVGVATIVLLCVLLAGWEAATAVASTADAAIPQVLMEKTLR